MVNGIDVQEHMNGGTSIIPNLDSIEEFRVLTNNFDPEYGNYNGGVVTVVSKQGSNSFTGTPSSFCATRRSMPRATSISPGLHSGRISLAARHRRPDQARQDLLLRRLPGNPHRPGRFNRQYHCPDARQRSGTFSDLTGCVSGPYLAGMLRSWAVGL
jgi:hypothetical protein